MLVTLENPACAELWSESANHWLHLCPTTKFIFC